MHSIRSSHALCGGQCAGHSVCRALARRAPLRPTRHRRCPLDCPVRGWTCTAWPASLLLLLLLCCCSCPPALNRMARARESRRTTPAARAQPTSEMASQYCISNRALGTSCSIAGRSARATTRCVAAVRAGRSDARGESTVDASNPHRMRRRVAMAAPRSRTSSVRVAALFGGQVSAHASAVQRGARRAASDGATASLMRIGARTVASARGVHLILRAGRQPVRHEEPDGERQEGAAARPGRDAESSARAGQVRDPGAAGALCAFGASLHITHHAMVLCHLCAQHGVRGL